MTQSIYIRPYLETDADALCEAVLASKAELRPWLVWCHDQYSIEDSRTWIAAQVEAFAAGQAYSFGIFEREERLLGGCGLNQISERNRMANLGYWVRSSATRRGVASFAHNSRNLRSNHSKRLERPSPARLVSGWGTCASV